MGNTQRPRKDAHAEAGVSRQAISESGESTMDDAERAERGSDASTADESNGRQSGRDEGADWLGESSEVGHAQSRDGQREAPGSTGHVAQPDQGVANTTNDGCCERRTSEATAIQRGCPERSEQQSKSECGGELSGRSQGLGSSELEHASSTRRDGQIGQPEIDPWDETWVPLSGAGHEDMVNTAEPRLSQRPSRPQGGSRQEQEPERPNGEGERQVESSLGRDADGHTSRLDLAELSGLSDSELAEIYHWMESGDNRTDELRMCGNGVVVATVERAFQVLLGRFVARLEENWLA